MGHLSTITKDLENVLWTHASQIGINSVKKPTKNNIGKYNAVIVSTGCQCVKTFQEFGLDFSTKKIKQKQYGIIVNFSPKSPDKYVHKEGKPLDSLKKFSPQHRYRGFRSRFGNYYIGISVSKEIRDMLPKETSYKDLPPEVKMIIDNALKYYHMTLDSDLLAVGFDMNFRYIIPFSRIETVKNKEKLFVAVGDCAFTSHFFGGQGINSGLRACFHIAENIEDPNFSNIYNTFLKAELDLRMEKIEEVIINHEKIQDICDTLNLKEIDDIAKQFNVKTTGLSRSEKCFVIGNNLYLKDN